MNNVQRYWSKIDGFASETLPSLAERLNPPASKNEIKMTEQLIGFRLPQDLRSSFAIHNGSNGLFFDGWTLCSLGYIRKSWRFYQEMGDHLHPRVSAFDPLPDGVQGERAWNPEWLFILKEEGGSEKLTVDCHPNGSNLSGPLFTWENYLWGESTVANNFEHFLQQLAVAIHDKKVEIDEDHLILDAI